MKWRDMAEISRELHPETDPQVGACYRSEDRRFTVALVDAGDPGKGWAVWYIAGPTMRILPSLPLTRAAQGMALAELLSVAVRGVAFVQRLRGQLRDVRSVLNNTARSPAPSGPACNLHVVKGGR